MEQSNTMADIPNWSRMKCDIKMIDEMTQYN